MSRAWAIFLIMALLVALSQFYRSSLGVIGPELMAELDLDPPGFGTAAAGFFIALGAVQIPLGLWLDRQGARVPILLLSMLTCAGALLNAAAWDAGSLVLARLMIGAGCACYWIGAIFLLARWFPPDRFALLLSWIAATGALGNLAATAPEAWLAATAGWRSVFLVAAAVTAVLALAALVIVRDRALAPGPGESLAEALAGLMRVVRLPHLSRIAAIQAIAYSCYFVVLGVWAGKYLESVHGLDEVARGPWMMAMAGAQLIGTLAFGPLDRRFNSRKGVISCGAVLTTLLLATLALLPAPPLPLAGTLLILLCLVTAYNVTIVAHGRALFPPALVGRGVTTLNMALVFGSAAVPVLTGWLFAAVSARGFGEGAAFRAVFAGLALLLALGLAWYRGIPDSRPLDEARA